MALYGYYIDLDERGSFAADVRDAANKTIFEIRAGDELAEGESSIFDDGFMRDKNDLAGLQEYLQQLGVIAAADEVVCQREFEARVDDELDDDMVDHSGSRP